MEGAEGEKTEITALDLRFLVRELREKLAGGIFRKIYQYGGSVSKQFLFDVFVPGGEDLWLYADRQKMFVTRRKKAAPQEPPSFCMFLRKHLMGKKITDVRQHEFDRIVEILTKDNILIFELLSPGNVILCDTGYNVIMPLQVQRWRDREVKPKSPYRYPPRVANPFDMDLDSLRISLVRVEKKLVAYLAATLGFGSVYASEICSRAGIDGNKATTEIGLNDMIRLNRTIEDIGNESLEPRVYDNTVSPFPLQTYKDRRSGVFGDFSEALDEYFSAQEIEMVREEVKKVVQEKKEKVERIVEYQEKAIEKWKGVEDESRDYAERIYSYYTIVEGVLSGIRKARESGLSWEEIKQKVKSEETPEAEAIKEIRENDGLVILDLGGKDVPIDIRKTPEQNAQRFYEDAKWAKRKYGGAGEAMERHGEKLQEADKEVQEHEQRDFRREVFPVEKYERGEKVRAVKEGLEDEAEGKEAVPEGVEETTPEEAEGYASEETVPEGAEGTIPEGAERPRRKRRRWYEKFKWFLSSQGFLVVAGRNAGQNEMLIKKHTDSRDLVFHADIQGAAFVVIKSEGHDIPDETKKEAAEFSAASSKAWSRGMGNVDIFSVKPEQVSKTPPSGQYLPKGSFVITGEREWHRNMELKLSVGVRVDREERSAGVLAGPVMAMRKNSDYFVTIKPGFKKSMELAKNIKSKILIKARPEDAQIIENIPLDEFQMVIPAGMGDVVEYIDRDYM